MPLNQVYITSTGSFLPNEAVLNEEMESFLGVINGQASQTRRIVLRNNGIQRRFYAIQKNGTSTHTNAEMAALAVRDCLGQDMKKLREVELLSCGTSSPDQMMPSHGVMVHGWLPEADAIEVVSPSGNCCSGMHALKYAYLAIKSNEITSAVTTGSERLSRILRAENYVLETRKLAELEGKPYISFEKDFLRWMLSDGAGAFLLSNQRNEAGISLRIDWLEGVSYAHQVETCMYQASDKLEDGTLKSYMDFGAEEIMSNSIFSMKQDVKLLSENIVALGFNKLKDICIKKNFNVADVDCFLPHLSSEFFRTKIAEKLADNGMAIPPEKWFTNLAETGNVGAGSIYLMVDELFKSKSLKQGQKILLAIPESARFSYVFGLMTVC